MALITPQSSFNPSDQELILNFLFNKINHIPLPSEATTNIHECEDLLFGEKKPWQIWKAFGGRGDGSDGGALYFFSIKKKKTSVVINNENGSWEPEKESRARTIMSKEGKQKRIGIKQSLVWTEKNSVSSWIIHKYCLNSFMVNAYYANNYVLCKLFKNQGDHTLKEESETKQSKQRKIRATTKSTDNNGRLKHPEIGAAAATSTYNNGVWIDASERTKRFKIGQPFQTQVDTDDDVGKTKVNNERDVM
ncbi:hypothetical protein AHAS_Ahas16G0322200 [Arachis hypogaea]